MTLQYSGRDPYVRLSGFGFLKSKKKTKILDIITAVYLLPSPTWRCGNRHENSAIPDSDFFRLWQLQWCNLRDDRKLGC